jgi:GNAT superfamily N-acetyltransferase
MDEEWSGMKSRTTYWQNSFPNHLEFTFHLEELKLAGAFDLPDDDDPVVTEGKKAKGCFVSFSRVGLAGTSAAAVKAKLEKFVGRDRARWNPQKYNFVGSIWETGKRPLAGFAAMDISLKKNARGQITDLTLDFKLMYIAKAHRGRGLGQMLAAAICVWLDHCKRSGVHVAKRGVSVLYYSEYESSGGVKCGDILREHFIYMQECRREFGVRAAGWRIREFIDEAGL